MRVIENDSCACQEIIDFTRMTKSTVGQTLVQLSMSIFDCFRVWWLRWTSGEDGC